MDADLGELGRRRRRANGEAFSPYTLFASGEQGVWYDPSDLTPEKVSWRRNLLTYSQDFENAAWTKSNASILSNLALYSQDFNNAWWSTARATISANTSVAPDGTTTAETLVEDTTSGTHPLFTPVLTYTANAFTFSVYVKASGRDKVRIATNGTAFGASPYVNYDLVAVTATGVGGATGSIVDAGNGWYRCIATVTATAGTGDIYFQPLNAAASPSYTGSGAASLLFWGAQLVPGSTAQTYTRSLATAAPIMFADPLGGTLADKLVENTANAQHLMSQTLAVAVGPFVWSAYAKAAERKRFTLRYGTVSQGYATFDVLAGTVVATDGTATITSVGSGWYLCTVSIPATSTGNRAHQLYLNTDSGSAAETYTGDGVSGIYVYGAQLEQASTASAYQRITDFSSDFLAAFPTHALYQESQGLTPVTSLGQSVGLVIDKRLGGLSALGPELVSTTWVVGDASWSQSGNVLIAVNGINFGISQPITGSGKRYAISFEVFDYASGTLSARAGSTGITGLSITANGVYTAKAQSSGDGSFYFMGNGTFTGRIRNISVREVPGNHALQATLAAQPTLQARSNLLVRTEQFDNAAWTKQASTVTANAAVAPDGTTTADKILEDTTNAAHAVFQAYTSVAVPYVFSFYAKAAERTWARTRGDLGLNYFNLSNGTVGTLAANVTATITDAGNGWYRISVSRTGTAGAANIQIGPTTGDAVDSYVGVATSGILAWGAQLEQASTASTYQRVVTATDYADVGLPRNLTFDGVDDSLATAGNVDFATWTVGTRRNLLTAPTMFDDAAWSKANVTVTANAIAAPDGTTTADKIEATTTAATLMYQTAGAVNATTVTFSFYGKQGSGATDANVFAVYNVTTASNAAVFNVNWATGAVTVTIGSATTTSTDVGNGWWRITATTSNGITSGNSLRSYAAFLGSTETAGEFSYLWGAQLEVGSTATAFQDVGTDKVTLFSGVTKLADPAAGGMVAELSATSLSNNGTFGFLAPAPANTDYYWRSRGTSSGEGGASVTAPTTNVVTCIGDIAGDISRTRRNGVQVTDITSDQGTGTYGAYLLYVGRRGGSMLPFNGRLFQLVIRGAATDSVTVGNAERWVGQLTGVAL